MRIPCMSDHLLSMAPLLGTSATYVGDMRFLEKVRRRWTKSIAGFETKRYWERMALLDLFSAEGR